MELTLDQTLQKGIESHKAEQFQDADKFYSAVLRALPKHPEANHNMGLLGVGAGHEQRRGAAPKDETQLAALLGLCGADGGLASARQLCELVVVGRQ